MKQKVREKMAEAFGVSKEIIMDIPHITLAGNREIYIENHKGILEYSREVISIKTTVGIMKITGQNLNIDNVRVEDMFISGNFDSLKFDF